MTAMEDLLRRDGSPGVHLGVSNRNQRAIGFYRHLGYEELAADAIGHTWRGASTTDGGGGTSAGETTRFHAAAEAS